MKLKVTIEGEPGSGKTLLANLIKKAIVTHNKTGRKPKFDFGSVMIIEGTIKEKLNLIMVRVEDPDVLIQTTHKQ
jgi:MoxR-like ATPase